VSNHGLVAIPVLQDTDCIWNALSLIEFGCHDLSNRVKWKALLQASGCGSLPEMLKTFAANPANAKVLLQPIFHCTLLFFDSIQLSGLLKLRMECFNEKHLEFVPPDTLINTSKGFVPPQQTRPAYILYDGGQVYVAVAKAKELAILGSLDQYYRCKAAEPHSVVKGLVPCLHSLHNCY